MPETETDRLRRLAMEALRMAGEMTNADCRSAMIEIAAAYARLAEYVEEHKATKPSSDKAD